MNVSNFDKLYELHHTNEWFKPKHLSMYRDFAFRAAQESSAVRRKVGAVILSKKGSLFIGYNGTPSGDDNTCENSDFITKDNVIHAEDNALRKMINENVDPQGSIIFITDSPCDKCTNNVIIDNGISAVFYFRYYTDDKPLEILNSNGVYTQYVDENYIEELRKHIITGDINHGR